MMKQNKMTALVFLGVVGFIPFVALASAHHGEGAEPALNWFELTGQILTFLVFVGGLVYFGRTPFLCFFSKRHETIHAVLEEAKFAKQQAEAKFREYQNKIKNVDSEIMQLKAQLNQSMENEQRHLVRRAEEMARRMVSDAQQAIQAEYARVYQDLKKEVTDMAIMLSENLVKKEIQLADQKRLTQHFVDGLGRVINKRSNVPEPVDGERL